MQLVSRIRASAGVASELAEAAAGQRCGRIDTAAPRLSYVESAPSSN